MIRLLTSLATVNLLVTVAGSTVGETRAQVPAPLICGIASSDLGGVDVCYPPSKVRVAERQLRISPIRPTSITKRLTGLGLTHLLVRRAGGVTAIDYLAGRIPRNQIGLPDLAGSASRYVLVGEAPGHGPYGQGKLVKIVTPAGSAQPRNEVYWQYYANFRCRRLTLIVTSNQPGVLVRRIGQGIQSLEACGK